MMDKEQYAAWCETKNICLEGRQFCNQFDFAGGWLAYKRPDWLLWQAHHMIGQPGWPDRHCVAEAARACAPALKSEWRPHCIEQANTYENHPDWGLAPMVLNEHDPNNSEGYISLGVYGDIEQATELARAALGPVPYDKA